MNTFEFVKAVSDTVFDMINAFYLENPLIFIRATYLFKMFKEGSPSAMLIFKGPYVSGEARLLSSGSE